MAAANANVQNFLTRSAYADASTDLTTNITRFLNDPAHAGTRQQKWQRLWFNQQARVIAARPGLVGFWRFNPTSGTTDVDRSGNGNTATFSGAITVNQAPAVSDGAPSALFAIASAQTSIADNAALHTGDVFSIEMWVRRSAIGLAANALIFYGGAVNTHSFQITTADTIIGVKDGVGTILTSTVTIADTTTWHHLAWTKNGAASCKLFLDAVDVSGVVTDRTISDSVGLNISLAFNAFAGNIANVAYYNRALTTAEVTESFILRP